LRWEECGFRDGAAAKRKPEGGAASGVGEFSTAGPEATLVVVAGATVVLFGLGMGIKSRQRTLIE
jgi:hypothetical protein